MSIPTFLMFKGGERVDQAVGGMPKEKLVEFIEKHI
jgi:thioredoxin-like negative regulator of GroEL